jgi:hypothetical protein
MPKAKNAPKKKKKKVSHMKLKEADLQLHLQPRTGRMQLIVTLPANISDILWRRLKKRSKGRP